MSYTMTAIVCIVLGFGCVFGLAALAIWLDNRSKNRIRPSVNVPIKEDDMERNIERMKEMQEYEFWKDFGKD